MGRLIIGFPASVSKGGYTGLEEDSISSSCDLGNLLPGLSCAKPPLFLACGLFSHLGGGLAAGLVFLEAQSTITQLYHAEKYTDVVYVVACVRRQWVGV